MLKASTAILSLRYTLLIKINLTLNPLFLLSIESYLIFDSKLSQGLELIDNINVRVKVKIPATY